MQTKGPLDKLTVDCKQLELNLKSSIDKVRTTVPSERTDSEHLSAKKACGAHTLWWELC